MTRITYGLGWTLVIGVAAAGLSMGMDRGAKGDDVVPVGLFSEMDPSMSIPDGWRSLSLAAVYETTKYDLVDTATGVVVRARSPGGASAIGTPAPVDLAKHPILKWRWKITSIVEGANARIGPGDDCPACVFVTFEYNDLSLARRLTLVAYQVLGDDQVPRRAIVYTWANRGETYTTFPDPHVSWMRQLVVQSGSTKAGQWQHERRNVRADYRRIFGEEPPPVKGVGVMTHTNKTNGDATSYYGDIVFRTAPSDSRAGQSRRRGGTQDAE